MAQASGVDRAGQAPSDDDTYAASSTPDRAAGEAGRGMTVHAPTTSAGASSGMKWPIPAMSSRRMSSADRTAPRGVLACEDRTARRSAGTGRSTAARPCIGEVRDDRDLTPGQDELRASAGHVGGLALSVTEQSRRAPSPRCSFRRGAVTETVEHGRPGSAALLWSSAEQLAGGGLSLGLRGTRARAGSRACKVPATARAEAEVGDEPGQLSQRNDLDMIAARPPATASRC